MKIIIYAASPQRGCTPQSSVAWLLPEQHGMSSFFMHSPSARHCLPPLKQGGTGVVPPIATEALSTPWHA